MTSNFSVYLDLMRFLAAMTVLMAHLTFPQFSGNLIAYQGVYAGAAVTAFFVLSGYVIAYVSAEKEKEWRSYAVSRAARIYSVAIPALILTVVLDWLGYQLGSAKALPMYQYLHIWKYLPVFLTFTSEIGPFRENVLSNGVFWSLSYEVWYYVLFGVAVYMNGAKKYLVLAVMAIVIGPRVLIMLPLWLAGVAIFYLHRHLRLNRSIAALMLLGSVAGLIVVRTFAIDDLLDNIVNAALHGGLDTLRNSMHFPGHYLVGLLLSLNIFSAGYCHFSWLELPAIKNSIRYCASFTFAIYLMHVPLRDFLAFLFHHQPGSVSGLIMLFLAILTGTWLLGYVSEQKKKWWRSLFYRLLYRPKANCGAQVRQSDI